MDPQTASRTTLATSLTRALHVRTDPHRILDDPWGDRLVPVQAPASVYKMTRSRVPARFGGAAVMRGGRDTQPPLRRLLPL